MNILTFYILSGYGHCNVLLTLNWVIGVNMHVIKLSAVIRLKYFLVVAA